MLPRPLRNASRYRLYGGGDVERLTFVRRARGLGFALEEVRALLALSVGQGKDTCVEVRQLAVGHLTDVRAKIADLRAMERMLSDAVRRCDAGEPAGCPDRKSTRLNSSHGYISYAVFCLKKKKKKPTSRKQKPPQRQGTLDRRK